MKSGWLLQPPPAPKAKGRPKKRQATREETIEAARALLQVNASEQLPLCTDYRAPLFPMSEQKQQEVERKLREAGVAFMETFIGGSPTVMALIQTAIRQDPRTQEIGQFKDRIDKLKETVESAVVSVKEEHALDNRILQDLADSKRKMKELEDSVEQQVTKRFMSIDANTKALQARLKAAEDRLNALEMRQ